MTPASGELQFLRKAGRHAWRRAWIILAVQVLASAAGAAAVKYISPRYRSTTTIRVEGRQIDNPLSSQARGRGIDDIEMRMRSLREEILARDYFEKVIGRLELGEPGATRREHEALIQRMIGNTEVVTRPRDVGTFQITYIGADPVTVRDVTNILAGIFIEDSLDDKSSDAGSAVAFLQSQLEVYRQRLEESETALRRYEEAHVDQVPATRAAQLARVEQMRGTLNEVENSLRQARQQRDLLRQRLVGASAPVEEPEGGAGARIPNPLQPRLREKEVELRRLLRDYSGSYPDVVALRAEIAELQREVEANPTVPADHLPAVGTNAVQDALAYGQLERLEIEVSSLTTREGQLQRELERAEKRVRGIPEVEQEMTRLRRDYDVNNDIYNNFLRRLEEARVSKELEFAKKGELFRILQAAQLPLSPIWPNRPQVLLAGIAVGLALNGILVFLLAQADTSFQSAAEAKAVLGVKVLSGLRRYRSRRQIAAARLKAATLVLLTVGYAAGVIAFLFWGQVSALLAGGV